MYNPLKKSQFGSNLNPSCGRKMKHMMIGSISVLFSLLQTSFFKTAMDQRFV